MMTIKKKAGLIIFGCTLLAAFLIIDGRLERGFIITKAQAVVGRPLTPGSYAGVARRTSRRTTRRVIRRSTIYHATLPMGCAQVNIDGTMLWLCGSTYYQSYNNQYVIVYID